MAKAPRPALRLVDRLVLLVAWLVTCGLVYVLGFYVGNRTQEHRAGLEEREVRLPVTSTPPPEGQRPKEAREFPSFYQALPGGERVVEFAQASTSTTTMAPATTLRSTTTVPAGFVSTPTTLRVPGTTTMRPTSTTTLAHPPAATTTPPSTVPPPTIARPVAPRGPSFTVEASPTRSRAEAEQLLATLRKRGYDAVLVQVQRDGDAWYRLRVGRYTTAEQANEVMRKLRDDGVPHAFVASE
ncbi:MAG: SPOR domain-containing protein [Candidatus Binatia bacterium]